MKKLRVYVDSSVIGGCFDKEFEKGSNGLFQMFEERAAIAVVSPLVYTEIDLAPEWVKEKLISLENIERVEINDEIAELAEKYLKEKIVTRKYSEDAVHIATSTYHNVDVLVSWNFKHIVNLQKIHQFNAINIREGYKVLEIRTPMEVIQNEQ
jgi:predicted nucleic acid-binding protein